MRINVRGPPVSGKAIKEGGGVYNFTFIILETGGICLENELKVALEDLEFILTSFIPFGIGDFKSLRGSGGGYLIYLGTGSKDIAIGGYHL